VVEKVRHPVVVTQCHLGVNQRAVLARKRRAMHSLSVVVSRIRSDRGETTNAT
jgi:hypothetical protein